MTPDKPAWTEKVEKLKNCRYVGLYDLPDREGPFYVFWQDEIPEQFRGDPKYDNYFGLIWFGPPEASRLFITGAKSIRDARFWAYEYEPGQFIVSRYRHDYVRAPNRDAFLDGGLAYMRCNPKFLPTHVMKLIDGVETFEPAERMRACR